MTIISQQCSEGMHALCPRKVFVMPVGEWRPCECPRCIESARQDAEILKARKEASK